MAKTEREKIVALEVVMNEFKADLAEIKADIKDIKTSLSPFNDHESRLQRLERSSNLWKWLSPTLAAVAGSAITFLLISYLQNK